MSLVERIEFSSHLASMYAEIARLSSRFCRERYALTLSDYELLLALRESDRPLLVSEMADFLVLQVGTVWQMTSSLAKRGLIVGGGSKTDARCRLYSLTGEGERLALRCSEDLLDHLNAICKRQLPEGEFFEFMNRGIASSLDALRGRATLCSGRMTREVPFKAEFEILIRVSMERWGDCVAEVCDLNLTQFRVLHVLDETQAVRVQDLADSLFLPRSQASACKNSLIARGYARQEQNPDDARSTVLFRMEKGTAAINDILPRLNEVIAASHNPGSDEGIAVLRAWIARMYSNLMSYWKANA